MDYSLKRLLESVDYNTSIRCQCPFCGGKDTFSVSNLGYVIKYNCFRNSCFDGSAGYYEPSASKDDLAKRYKERTESEVKDKFELPKYVRNGLGSSACFNLIMNTNGLDSYNRGMYKVSYDQVQERLLHVITDNSCIVGAVGRSLNGSSPKSLVYPNSAIMPFIVGNTKTGVIVEDCLSAASINSIVQYTGIALLGTNIKDEYIPWLKEFKQIIIALDPDARRKAIDLKQSLSYICEYVKIWNIPTDFKNMNKNQIEEFISENH